MSELFKVLVSDSHHKNTKKALPHGLDEMISILMTDLPLVAFAGDLVRAKIIKIRPNLNRRLSKKFK